MKNSVIYMLFLIFISIIWDLPISQGAKLNKPRVLLPLYSQYPNNFTLQVDEGVGCYKWSTKTPNIVQVTVVDTPPSKTCSSKAVVGAVTSEDARHSAVVFAEDLATGEILRCDVIVDSIASLVIVTTTREIFIEENPEVFEVRAYDESGNQFTTLDGFKFDWSVTAVTRKGQPIPALTHKVIKLMKFEESNYKVPTLSLAEIESAGYHGNKALLYGMSTGQAQVAVSLLQPQYKNVPPASPVILAVIANLILDPQDTLLMPNTKVTYRLELVRQGRLEQLQLPSDQYKLEVEEGSIARLEEGTSLVEALVEGRTRVLLRDSNVVDPEEEGRAISATIRVGHPVSLDIEVLPSRSWYAVVGRDYTLHVRILDANKHAFHVGDDVHISIDVPRTHFKTKEMLVSDLNGRALAAGSVPVLARLRGTKLTAEGTLIINDLVSVIPKESYLPWVRQTPSYEFPLYAFAETGDGKPASFVWHTKSPGVASITQDSVVTTRSDVKAGAVANISVSLDRDPLNTAYATVHFLPPCRLVIPSNKVLQAEVGTFLHIPIAVYVCHEKQEFLAQRCEHLKFDVSSDFDLTINSTSKDNTDVKLCTSIPVFSSRPTPLTQVSVRLNVMLEDGNVLYLEDSVTVSFFNPLRVIYPASGETVLAPDTSRNIIFEGGPRVLPGQQALKRHITMVDGNQIAKAWDLDRESSNVVLLRVLCSEIGNTELQLSLSPANDPRIQSRGSVKIYCALPDRLVLIPNLPAPDYQHCSTSSGSYVTLAKREFELVANVFDKKGRSFDNISSIAIHWNLSPQDLTAKLPVEMLEDVIREETYGLMMPGKIYHVIKPWGQPGSLIIRASLKVLDMEEVSGETKVDLVDTLLINPTRISVYNHTSKVARFKVNKGSSSYIINVMEGEGIADINLVKSRRTVEVTPKKPGRLRFSLVDACLPEELREAAIAEVLVLGVGSVRVSLASQVQVGNTIEATLALLDTDGQELSPPTSLPIVPHADHGILELKQLAAPLKFSVKGLTLGDSEVKFTVDDAESQPASVHVFPPIKIWPRDLVLVPGAKLQASTQGGPNVPDATLIFSAATHEKPSAVHMSESGVLNALHVGTSTLSVRAMAPDDSLYSEDSTPLKVVALTGIEIWVPTRKLEQGTRMPAYVQGKSNNDEIISPFVMATLQLKYSWKEHGGSLLVHSKESLVHVEALNVGMTELSVEVVLEDSTRLVHSLNVEVIPAQRLTLPVGAPAASPLLIAPRSKVQLAVTNGRFLLNCGGEGIISVTENGLVTSLGPLGRVTIIVPDHKTNQELEIVIKVVPIHYIMTTANAPVSNDIYPRGMKAPVYITYHDSIGREILVPSTERTLRWISSRPQTMSLKRDRLQMGEPGTAVMDVWDQNHHAYLMLTVTQIISPVALSVGDHACFTMAQSGEWSAQPKTVMKIHSQSGWAVASQAGEANVKFVTEEGSSTWAEVQVLTVSKLQWLPTDQPLAINSYLPLSIPFVIKASGEQNKHNNIVGKSSCMSPPIDYQPNLPVECRAAWEDASWDSHLQTSVSFNFKTGVYSCNITAKLHDSSSKLSVSVCMIGNDLCSEKLSIPFYKPIKADSKEVFIGASGGQIVVSGPPLALAQIKVDAPPSLEVGQRIEVITNSIAFPVTLTPLYWSIKQGSKFSNMFVTLNSPLTGQTLILPVVVENNIEAPTCPSRPIANTTWMQWLKAFRSETIAIISGFIIMAAILHTFWSSYQYQSMISSTGETTNTRQQVFSPSPFAANSSFLSSGNNSLNTSGFANTSSQENRSLPYASTSHVYGSQNEANWLAGTPRRS